MPDYNPFTDPVVLVCLEKHPVLLRGYATIAKDPSKSSQAWYRHRAENGEYIREMVLGPLDDQAPCSGWWRINRGTSRAKTIDHGEEHHIAAAWMVELAEKAGHRPVHLEPKPNGSLNIRIYTDACGEEFGANIILNPPIRALALALNWVEGEK